VTCGTGGAAGSCALRHTLRALGIVVESTGRQRDRLYTYTRQLDILNRGTAT